jgi:hypothetical protein
MSLMDRWRLPGREFVRTAIILSMTTERIGCKMVNPGDQNNQTPGHPPSAQTNHGGFLQAAAFAMLMVCMCVCATLEAEVQATRAALLAANVLRMRRRKRKLEEVTSDLYQLNVQKKRASPTNFNRERAFNCVQDDWLGPKPRFDDKQFE